MIQSCEDCRKAHPNHCEVHTPAVGSVDATLAERGARYGDFTDNARISQGLISYVQDLGGEGWERLDFVKKEALTVIMAKVARILNGDPNYKDNWHDIAGYAKLAEDRCKD